MKNVSCKSQLVTIQPTIIIGLSIWLHRCSDDRVHLTPPEFVDVVVDVFQRYGASISTLALEKGLTSDMVLKELRPDLFELGFEVEEGKRKDEKIDRPVFFGENAQPTLHYQIDAFHTGWQCGLEIEAGRAWMGNAVYRDLVQACVMVQVEHLVLGVPIAYKYKTSGRSTVSHDYAHAVSLAETLYGHSRLRLPYDLVLIGY